MRYNNKLSFTKRKAFTLIELLIVIAIIGILFIVLVSKVDFATDKAKATGVQTDFRAFQVAIESVAKEHAGLATFGWDTGDANGNRIRDSYDKGDTNKNGVQDDGEVFVGSKTYGETWTKVYTLTNPADANDKSAIAALESAINKNLDPKLHITIHDDYIITMANGARDPWGNEYYGYYISNAENDGKDRGAIVIFSSGANGEHGCEHDIAGGLTTVSVPGNNVYGKDDYSIATVYTYVNGYGEVKTTTTGFSQNQGGGQAGTDGTFAPGNGGSGETPDDDIVTTGNIIPDGGKYTSADGTIYEAGTEMPEIQVGDIYEYMDYTYQYKKYYQSYNDSGWKSMSHDGWGVRVNDIEKSSYTDILNDINGKPIVSLHCTFSHCQSLISTPKIPDSAIDFNRTFQLCSSLVDASSFQPKTAISMAYTFLKCSSLKFLPDLSNTNITNLLHTFDSCIGVDNTEWNNLKLPYNVQKLEGTFKSSSVENVSLIKIPDSVTSLSYAFRGCKNIKNLDGFIVPSNVMDLNYTFSYCENLTDVSGITLHKDVSLFSTFMNCSLVDSGMPTLPYGITSLEYTFENCTKLINLSSFVIPESVQNMSSSFKGCTSLVVAPIIPSSVTNLNYAFASCQSLTTIGVIPENVNALRGTFEYCTSLSGDIIINTNKKMVISNQMGVGSGQCDRCFAYTTQPINIIGDASSSLKEILSSTATNNNVTFD